MTNSERIKLDAIRRATNLARIKAEVKANYAAGRPPYDGLSSSEIGIYSRALMFGDNDEGFPDAATWARIVD